MKILTFGELMLRLAPTGYTRFMQNNTFEATFGGGEANVAVSLAQFGMDVDFVTKLPNNAIADAAIRELRGFGVGTQGITKGGDRIGIYYLEKGASQRASQVIYDRAHSSISEAQSSDFDWDTLFEGVTWFHFTGITPALNPQLVDVVIEACTVAKAKGITISCDINYRKKLWTKEEAHQAMTKIAPYIDVLIGNEEDAQNVFNIVSDDTDVVSGALNHSGYEDVAKKLSETYGFKHVAITLRESINANNNRWSAMLYTDKQANFSRIYDLNIVDRVGGGDSFGAGLIYALSNNYSANKAIEFAVAASCLKHSIEGDYNRVSLSEVETLLKGDGSGRVQR